MAEFVIATVIVSVPLQFLTIPIWYWTDTLHWFGPDWFWNIDNAFEAFGLALVGIPLLLLMPCILVGMGRGHAHLAQALLGTNREAELTQQVDHLTASRTQAAEHCLAEAALERNERTAIYGPVVRSRLSLHRGSGQRLHGSDRQRCARIRSAWNRL